MKRWQFILSSSLVLGFAFVQPGRAAVWQEPTCDPTVDPASCNAAVPLNVSSSGQIKEGSLTVNSLITATRGFSLTGGSLVLPADSITDAMVVSDVTAGKFRRGTGGTDAVDLGSWSATDSSNVEVFGSLSSSAINDIWVKRTGDTMTGQLVVQNTTGTGVLGTGIEIHKDSIDPSARGIEINGTGAGSYLFINQQGTSADAIYIGMNSTVTGKGINIQNSSSDANSVPLYINNLSSPAMQVISVQTQATNGYGLSSASTGTNGRGVLGSGSLNGIYGINNGVATSSDTAGVFGYSSTATGVIGRSQASSGIGVWGDSIYGTGVYGNTASSLTSNYGVIGCKNGTNCGSLGGTTWAGYFDYDTAANGQVVGERFLPTQPETFGYTSYLAGTILGSVVAVAPSNPWRDVEYLGSDGSEIWVFNDHRSGNPYISRVEAATGKTITAQGFGVYPAYAATLTSKGLIYISDDAASLGSTYGWYKDAAKPTLITTDGAADKTHMNRLLYDGTYIWGGKYDGSGIDRFDATTYNGDSITIGSSGGAIIDFEQDGQYIYALTDMDRADPSSNSKIMRINPTTNGVDKEFVIESTQLGRLLFDGRYLWATTSYPEDGVYRIDVKDLDNGGTGKLTLLNFGTRYSSFVNPYDLVFDGTFIWVSLRDSNTIARFSPIQDSASPTIFQDKFFATATTPERMVFDGQSVWVEHDGNSAGPVLVNPIYKFASGKGYGYQTGPIARGVSSYDVSTGDATCMYVDGGAVKVTTGAFCP